MKAKKITKLLSPKSLVIAILLLVFFAEGIFVLSQKTNYLDFLFPKDSVSESRLQKYADQVLAKCRNSEFTPNCYDKEIPKLMKYISMEDAFKVTRYVQKKDSKYYFCHVLAHNLSTIEVAKNPDNWKDVIARCPATMCNNGCPHGVLMYKFQAESLTDEQIETILPDLKEVCESREGWNPSEVEVGMCYHGLGHLNMYITDADINKSIELCEEIAVKDDGRDYYQTCVQGVFMIIYQGIEPEDFALVKDIKPEKDEVEEFCSSWTGLENTACRTEAWPLFNTQIRSPQGLVEFCSFTDDPYSTIWCYDTGLSLVVLELLETVPGAGVDKVADYCTALPGDKKELCFGFAATRFVQVDPEYTKTAIELCQIAENYGEEARCWHDMLFYSQYSFEEGTEKHTNFCNAFPEDKKELCLTGEVPDQFYYLQNNEI